MTAQTISGVGAEVAARTGIVPAARTAGSTNGTGFDRRGFNSCVLITQTGAETGGPSARTYDAKLQHSDTLGGTYTDYTPSIPQPGATGAAPQIAAANTTKKRSIDLKSAKAFIRVADTVALTGGSSPTLAVGAVVVLGGADVLPIADDT